MIKNLQTLITKGLGTLRNLYATVYFNYWRLDSDLRNGKVRFPYNPLHQNENIYILCNGPSLNKELELLANDKTFLESDKICVNYQCREEIFRQLKPKFFCIADPRAFQDINSDKAMFRYLNDYVEWPMTLFIPCYGKEVTESVRNCLTNGNITVSVLPRVTYSGNENKRYHSWKSGLSVPSFVNISIMGIYVALNMGYQHLNLCGVDHTFFDNMGVDEENRLYITDRHSYGVERRYIAIGIYGYWKIKDWLKDKYLTFLEHERMQGYAEYLGAEIINFTENSLIDAYPRLKRIKSES